MIINILDQQSVINSIPLSISNQQSVINSIPLSMSSQTNKRKFNECNIEIDSEEELDFIGEPDTQSINVKCISNLKHQKKESDSIIKNMKVNSNSHKKSSNSNSISTILRNTKSNSIKTLNQFDSDSEEELDFIGEPDIKILKEESNKDSIIYDENINAVGTKVYGMRENKKIKVKSIIREFSNDKKSHILNVLKNRGLSVHPVTLNKYLAEDNTLRNYIAEVEKEDRAENMHKSTPTLMQPGPLCEVASGVDHKSQCEAPVVIEKFSKSNKPTHESDSLMDGVENENDLIENLESNLKNSANLENSPNFTNLKSLFDLNSSLKNMLHNSMDDDYYPHNRIVYVNVIYNSSRLALMLIQ